MDESWKMTPLDRISSSGELQMIKALLPYAPASSQSFLIIFIKIAEIKKLMSLFSNREQLLFQQEISDNSPPPFSKILEEIRQYMGEQQRRQIDQMLNFLQMMELYRQFADMGMFQQLGNMMSGSPEENNSAEGNQENPDGEFGAGMNLDMTDLIKSMLSPEQQEMFDTYGSMFRQTS